MDDTVRADARQASAPTRLSAGAVLALLGVLLWVLAVVVGRDEPRSWQSRSAPPQWVPVTAGQTYSLGTVHGLDGLTRHGVDAQSLQCSLTVRGAGTSVLTVTAESSTKALHRIATFISPVTDDVHVTCPQAGSVYVDDADGSPDYAGWLRVLATVLLTVGLPVLLSGLASWRPREQVLAGP